MVPSKTYLKFKETRSQEDLETLNSYLKRLSEISDILNGDEDLDNETENSMGTLLQVYIAHTPITGNRGPI